MERCGTDPKQDNDKISFFIEPSSSCQSPDSLPVSTHPAPHRTVQHPSLLQLPVPEKMCKLGRLNCIKALSSQMSKNIPT